MVVHARSATYFRHERLSSAIYKPKYNIHNKHLPVEHTLQQYDALVFLTTSRDDINGLRALLDAGRKVNVVNHAGDTPLLVAVKHNAINATRLLIARHADLNVTDKDGLTPLAIATQHNNYPIIRALEEMGASGSGQHASAAQ